MPAYTFLFLPEEREPITLILADDATAIAEANRALSDLLFDAATELRTLSTRVEVRKEDGALLAEITPHT